MLFLYTHLDDIYRDAYRRVTRSDSTCSLILSRFSAMTIDVFRDLIQRFL